MTPEQTHDHDAYRAAVAEGLQNGWRFGGLHVSMVSGRQLVRALLVDKVGTMRLESTQVKDGTVPTIVDLAPAGWDEREAHDLHGVGFAGHEPLRPLADHNASLSSWTTPVRGADAYQVAVGPIHAGVIESGHFRFHVVGDRILHLDPRLFYKHRGLERAAEGQPLAAGLVYAARACAACSVANSIAYAHACEQALGLTPTRQLARARTLLLELERVWNTLNDIAAVCAGVGLAAGTTRFAALVEDARRLNQQVSGHRFLFGTIAVGGSTLELDAATIAQVRGTLTRIRQDSTRAWRELLFNASFMDRMPDIGVVDKAAALTLGVVGPAARASGITDDVRSTSPRLAYDGFEPAVLRRVAGDVQSRLEQKALELLPCLDILDGLLAEPVHTATAVKGGQESAIGVGRVESPRGATTCVVERDGDHLSRLRLRTGSYANWPVVAYAAADNLLPDFPLINKSFELCYACADR